jgi:transcriptional regulator with XRE-family HTH domain
MKAIRLSSIRKTLGLSQERLARILGVSFASVNRWENGRGAPSGIVLEVYLALDAALKNGRTAEQILGEDARPGMLLYRIFRNAYMSRTGHRFIA